MGSAIQISGVTKRFGPTVALADVSFDIQAGHVHALVGENGAGKSSLIKVLSGVHRPDGGAVLLDGKPYHPHGPTEAQRAGVSTMFQESQRIANLSVGENVFLGMEPRRGPLINWPKLFGDAAILLQRLRIPIDPRQKMGDLTSSESKLIEMARAVSREAKVLIMDEPTANLNQAEQQILFDVLRNLNQNEGVTIVYISHHLQEVFDLCRRVTVLRDGRHVVTSDVSETTPDQLVENMIGRQMESFYPPIEVRPFADRLEVRQLRRAASALSGVNLKIGAGEIYGIYGLADSGRTALVNCLFGITPQFEGEITLDGAPYRASSPMAAVDASVALVPEDRKLQGLMLDLDLLHNLSAASFGKFSTAGLFSSGAAKANAAEIIADLKVNPPDPRATAKSLSGGNQQKIAIGKWLNLDFKLAIFQEPTRGIDVGAKMEVYRVIEGLSQRGISILLISSEIMELMGMCHRIGVLVGGAIAAEFTRGDFTERAIVSAALPRRTQ